MATYYVSNLGSNTAPYDTWETAAHLTATVVNFGSLVPGPHYVYIAAGEYASPLILSANNWAGSVIAGTVGHGATDPAESGQVILSPATGHILQISQPGITVANVDLAGNAAGLDALFLNAAGFNGSNLQIYDAGRYTINANNATNFRIKNSKINGAGSIVYPVFLYGNTSGSFEICVFGNGKQGKPSDTRPRMYISSSGTISINNSIIRGSYHSAIWINATGELNITNTNIFSGLNGDDALLHRAAGTVNIKNSHIGMSWVDHRQITGVLTTNADNIYNLRRDVTRYGRTGWIIPTIDDSVNWEYTKSLETLFRQYGVRGSLAADAYQAIQPENKDGVQSVIDGGIFDVEYHSYAHTHLGYGSTNAVMTIEKSGASINVDRATDTITVDPGGVVQNFRGTRIWSIRDQLVAMGCFVVLSTRVGSMSFGEIMDNVSGASPQSPRHLIDVTCETGLYKVEVATAVDIMQSNFTGLRPTISFVTPFGESSVTLQAAVKNYGIHSVRSNLQQVNASWSLSKINMYGLTYIGNATMVGVSEGDSRNYAHALAQAVADGGQVVSIVSHGSTEFSAADWELIFQVLAEYPEVRVGSLSDFVEHVLQSGEYTTHDGITYTRSWSEDADYNLVPTSPCIGAGVDVGLTTDADGNAVPGAVGYDIGPYSYMPGWTLFDSTMPPLSLSPDCPGKLKQVQEWTRSDVSIEKISKYFSNNDS